MARQQKQAASEAAVTAAPVKTLFERVTGYLDANDWHYTADEEKQHVFCSYRLKDTTVRVIVDVYEAEDWQRVLAYSCFQVFVPENRRAAVAETIAGMNYGMVIGNLEMDPTDGEVRVRTAVESDSLLGDAMIERALGSNLQAADRFFAPIVAVAFSNAAPEKALEVAAHDAPGTVQ